MLTVFNGMMDSMLLLGQDVVAVGSMAALLSHLLAAAVFAVLGIVVLFLTIFLMDKVTRFSIVKEVIEEHNQALATIVAAVVVGISLIIASAIFG